MNSFKFGVETSSCVMLNFQPPAFACCSVPIFQQMHPHGTSLGFHIMAVMQVKVLEKRPSEGHIWLKLEWLCW